MFSLPLLPPQQPLVDQGGTPTVIFQQWWQQVVQAIVGQEDSQNAIIDRIRRVVSHTVPTTILHARDDGANATITIDSHTRVYGDATTLAISGGSVSGLASNTAYAGYYDDQSLSNPSPAFHFTTDIALAQTVSADGRHFLGVITTPAAGSGATVDGGGVYAAGSNVGGELE